MIAQLASEDGIVRVKARERLVAFKARAVIPLIDILSDEHHWVREGVHHVLHDMNKGNLHEILLPVLAALEGNNPALEVPLAAQTALAGIEKRRSR